MYINLNHLFWGFLIAFLFFVFVKGFFEWIDDESYKLSNIEQKSKYWLGKIWSLTKVILGIGGGGSSYWGGGAQGSGGLNGGANPGL